MRGIDRSEEDASDDLQFVAHKHGSSTRLRGFHRFDPDMRPIDTRGVFPLRELHGGLQLFALSALNPCRGRFVQPLGVFLNHPVGIKDRSDTSHRLPHQLDPGNRNAAVRFGVVERDDLVFQNVEQAVGSRLRFEIPEFLR